MFCSICFKQKKSKKSYESHYTRDRSTGRVTCPIVQAHMCLKCGKPGHFEDYCVEIVKKFNSPKKKKNVSDDGWSIPIGFNKVVVPVIVQVVEDVIDDSPCLYGWRVGFDWATAMGCD